MGGKQTSGAPYVRTSREALSPRTKGATPDVLDKLFGMGKPGEAARSARQGPLLA